MYNKYLLKIKHMLKKTWDIIVGIICIIMDLISPIIYLIPVSLPFLIVGSLIEVILYGCAKGEAFLMGTDMNIFTYEGSLICTAISLTLCMLLTIIHIVYLFFYATPNKLDHKQDNDKDEL